MFPLALVLANGGIYLIAVVYQESTRSDDMCELHVSEIAGMAGVYSTYFRPRAKNNENLRVISIK